MAFICSTCHGQNILVLDPTAFLPWCFFFPSIRAQSSAFLAVTVMAMLRKHIYRTLLKLGTKFDQNPRMKAFVFTGEARFPEFDEKEHEMDQVILMEDVDRAMKDIVDSACAPGIFYKPEVSFKDMVRKNFRSAPMVELDEHAQNQLGFMAIRLLYNCEKLALELTYKGPTDGQTPLPLSAADVAQKSISTTTPTESEPASTVHNSAYFQPTNDIQAGSILVSHPLRVQHPFNNAVLLVTEVTDDGSACILLNKEFEGDFKSQLIKDERIRYGHYLRPFYDMPCFIGGDSMFVRNTVNNLNFGILHRQEKLAHLSSKIYLADGTDASTFVPQFTTEPLGASIEASEREKADFVYFSHDFSAIGKELIAGTVVKEDLKVGWCAGCRLLSFDTTPVTCFPSFIGACACNRHE